MKKKLTRILALFSLSSLLLVVFQNCDTQDGYYQGLDASIKIIKDHAITIRNLQMKSSSNYSNNTINYFDSTAQLAVKPVSYNEMDWNFYNVLRNINAIFVAESLVNKASDIKYKAFFQLLPLDGSFKVTIRSVGKADTLILSNSFQELTVKMLEAIELHVGKIVPDCDPKVSIVRCYTMEDYDKGRADLLIKLKKDFKARAKINLVISDNETGTGNTPWKHYDFLLSNLAEASKQLNNEIGFYLGSVTVRKDHRLRPDHSKEYYYDLSSQGSYLSYLGKNPGVSAGAILVGISGPVTTDTSGLSWVRNNGPWRQLAPQFVMRSKYSNKWASARFTGPTSRANSPLYGDSAYYYAALLKLKLAGNTLTSIQQADFDLLKVDYSTAAIQSNASVFLHELGHNMGLGHGEKWHPEGLNTDNFFFNPNKRDHELASIGIEFVRTYLKQVDPKFETVHHYAY